MCPRTTERISRIHCRICSIPCVPMLPEASVEPVPDEVCGWFGCLSTKCKVSPFSTSKNGQGKNLNRKHMNSEAQT